MSVLRSEIVIALNDVVSACREAASQHQTAADACGDEALRGALAALSRERSAAIDEISQKVQELGDVPNAPPHEKELFESAVTRVKAALSDDELTALLDDCQAKELRVAEAAAAAVAHAGDDALRTRLERLGDDAKTRIPALRRRL
jgi:uncharacterized protein (TIGR02284 family)